jgi:RNA polymerase sigma-70 factor, ECF subfamily
VDDAELVEQARRGDTAAFGELVDRYRTAVHRAALAATGAPDESEDVAQEAFVSAFRHLGAFRGESSFKTWLLAITWRIALTRRKSLWTRLRRFRSSEEAPIVEPRTPGRSQEQQLVDGELVATVRRLVRSLPSKFRDPVMLSATGEYTFDEMAAMLGVPSGTLKWRAMEGRRRLKAKLAALGYESR